MAEDQPGEIEPVYLTLGDVIGLHSLIIGSTAAEAADQLRNRGGLESALARPGAYGHYESADLALQAAVRAHGIAESADAESADVWHDVWHEAYDYLSS